MTRHLYFTYDRYVCKMCIPVNNPGKIVRNEKMKEFLKRKNVIFSAKRYGIDCLGAMAQGLFASLLIGTIISTLGEQLGIAVFVTIGGYAKAATGAAMAISIGYALQCPPLVLFSLAAVGVAANELGGAGGPLSVRGISHIRLQESDRIAAIVHGHLSISNCWNGSYPPNQQCGNLRSSFPDRTCRRGGSSRMLRTDGRFCSHEF